MTLQGWWCVGARPSPKKLASVGRLSTAAQHPKYAQYPRADMGKHGLDLDGGFVGQHALHALIYLIDPGVAGNSRTSSLRMCQPYRFFTHLNLYRRLHDRLVEGQPLDLVVGKILLAHVCQRSKRVKLGGVHNLIDGFVPVPSNVS